MDTQAAEFLLPLKSYCPAYDVPGFIVIASYTDILFSQ